MACRSLRRSRGQCRPDAGGRALRAGEGFRLATYAVCDQRRSRIHPALVSLVKMGTTVNQKKVFFNLRSQEQALRAGRGRPAPRPGQADRQRWA